ncbi:elongator complex protein 4-like [Paramacrobiotus metropolitanus]|uniref:elongator complex protein 4-like n=1 Tax=Paramacrobiotus metropolitanus TaxID=2943436 RepID=UPI002445A20F|nr:elongator complex protein 4-like [Paramacrobiotus metropolitanus]
MCSSMDRGIQPVVHSSPQIRSASGLSQTVLQGCKSSLITSQAITSSGSPGLNQIFNGGVPVGTVVVLEDRPCHLYSRHFMLLFAAEGLSVGHRVCVAAARSVEIKEFISDIPRKVTGEESSGLNEGLRNPLPESIGDRQGDGLKIAFRYESLPKIDSVLGASHASAPSEPQYDLGRKIDASQVETVGYFTHSHSSSPAVPSRIHRLLEWILNEAGKIPRQNVLRVCLPAVDSPLWNFHDSHEFFRFLFQLRTLARQNSLIISLSISHSLHSPADLFRIRRLSDAYVVLETLKSEKKHALYRDYQALFRIEKTFAVNVLRPPVILDCEYGLKIKRRRVLLERLHLPPALPETAQRETTDHPSGIRSTIGGLVGNQLGCQAATERNLDF